MLSTLFDHIPHPPLHYLLSYIHPPNILLYSHKYIYTYIKYTKLSWDEKSGRRRAAAKKKMLVKKMEIKMYNNKSTSTTQHKEKKMSHSKYKKLSVNSLLPTIFLLTLQPLIPQISFMKKQQQRNGIMWIITFPNKQYFFTLSLLFIFHVVVYSVDVRALRFHDGFETNVLRRMGKEKKLKWKKKRKGKKFRALFLLPHHIFFFLYYYSILIL